MMLGNMDAIRKIISNLTGNAVKYTDRGGITLRFLKEDTDSSDGSSIILRIEVEDTGVGIAPEGLDRVFLPFERGALPSSAGYDGTGLGLAIVKNLVDAMKGTIRCESSPGKGSRFIVRIPQKIQDREPIGQRSA